MLIHTLQLVINSPAFKGACAGALASARTDFDAFRTWHSFKDLEGYSWSIAAWRWFQGAIIGAVTAAGIGGLL